MSYCVNCGVKLEDSESVCPLCGTEVVNPSGSAPARRSYPYPRRVEAIDNRLDRRIFTGIALIAALIPAAITVFYDAVAADGLSWSLFVVGALALLLVVTLVPINFPRMTAARCVALDSVCAALYVLLIERLCGGGWYLRLGLPLSAAGGAALTLAVWLCSTRVAPAPLSRLAVVLFCIGGLSLAVELIIGLYFNGAFMPVWSIYVAVPCALLGTIALLLRRRMDIKDEIRRRFFF